MKAAITKDKGYAVAPWETEYTFWAEFCMKKGWRIEGFQGKYQYRERLTTRKEYKWFVLGYQWRKDG